MTEPIYMDANATTPVLPEVVAAMQPFWAERFGNASAVHSFGRRAKSALETAREQVATLICGRPTEVTFTGGGTESDNLALFGLLQAGDHLIVSAVEHDAVLHAADALEAVGIQVTRVGCNANGIVEPETVQAALEPNTKLISVMLANNETGVLQPVEAIAKIAHAAGALLHTDAIQAGGKMRVDVMRLGCDLLSLSAHKMYAPQGVGALWVRSGLKIKPLLHGGSHERRRRAGTENVPGIAGFGAAAAIAGQWLASVGAERLAELRDSLEATLLARVPDSCVHGARVARLPNTTSIRFHGVDAERLVIALDLQGLAVSGGSACQSGAVEPSHVLRAMGLTDSDAKSSVRLSLSRSTTASEVERAAELIALSVNRLRNL